MQVWPRPMRRAQRSQIFLQCEPSDFAFSTGVILEQLPVDRLIAGISGHCELEAEQLVRRCGSDRDHRYTA